MNIEDAIKLAIEKGGYDTKFVVGESAKTLIANNELEDYSNDFVLDPAFWTSLGKALGWNGKRFDVRLGKLLEIKDGSGKYEEEMYQQEIWLYHALRYFELKLTGGNEEEFWSNLLEKGV